tara:strand:+ start:148 stop:348 length:201 start_codon:yes stop_codon:yes gene_type:complete
MTPRIEKIYNLIYYSDFDEYEIKQLAIGLLGTTLNDISWQETADTVSSYKLDDQVELDFEPEDSLR